MRPRDAPGQPRNVSRHDDHAGIRPRPQADRLPRDGRVDAGRRRSARHACATIALASAPRPRSAVTTTSPASSPHRATIASSTSSSMRRASSARCAGSQNRRQPLLRLRGRLANGTTAQTLMRPDVRFARLPTREGRCRQRRSDLARASRVAIREVRIIVRVTRPACRASAACIAASASIDHVAVDQAAVVGRDRCGVAGTPSSAMIFAVGPLTAWPPIIGETAMTGAPRVTARRARRARPESDRC